MVDGQVQCVFLDEEVLVQGVAILEAVVKRTDVAAGTEGFFTGAAQDYCVHLRVIGPGF